MSVPSARLPQPAQFVVRGIVPTAEQSAIQIAPENTIIIEANAGAAKTTTLALRMAESWTRGVQPRDCLALTYTDEAREALTLALGRGSTGTGLWRTLIGAPAFAYLAVPAVVLSLGFFLLVRNLGLAPASAAPFVVVLGNSLLALPFAMATLGPPLETNARTRGKLIRSLGLSGWRQFVAVEYPLLGKDIGVMLALAFCFSLGDLGVIALFGTQDFQTLPLLMFRALGA